MFNGHFNIKIDSSQCTSLTAGTALVDGVYDSWEYSNMQFESGRIYALVGEYKQGNVYLSYLLGGNVELGNLKLFCNGNEISKEDLSSVSWNLEPSREPYKNNIVRESIEKAIENNGMKESFQDIVERFLLTEPRYDRKLHALSGERWRASAALGYAEGKRIFYAPYMTSSFYYQMCHSGLLKVLRELTDSGALVVLPVGSDEFIKHIADECVYIKRKYNIEQVKREYKERFNNKDWIK